MQKYPKTDACYVLVNVTTAQLAMLLFSQHLHNDISFFSVFYYFYYFFNIVGQNQKIPTTNQQEKKDEYRIKRHKIKTLG